MAITKESLSVYRTSHQTIIDMVEQILTLVRSYKQVKPKIKALDKMLTAHFSRQNRRMYAELAEKYKGNREAEKMIEFLVQDVNNVKVEYLTFIEKHTGDLGDNNERMFPLNFQAFARELLARIKTEEDYLLPLIQNMAE